MKIWTRKAKQEHRESVSGKEIQEHRKSASGKEKPQAVIPVRNDRMLGIGFIKSRRADGAVMDMCEEMKRKAKEEGITLIEMMVDRSTGDYDRKGLDKLHERMQNPAVNTVVLRRMEDITDDLEDQIRFLGFACSTGTEISVIKLESDREEDAAVPVTEVTDDGEQYICEENTDDDEEQHVCEEYTGDGEQHICEEGTGNGEQHICEGNAGDGEQHICEEDASD